MAKAALTRHAALAVLAIAAAAPALADPPASEAKPAAQPAAKPTTTTSWSGGAPKSSEGEQSFKPSGRVQYDVFSLDTDGASAASELHPFLRPPRLSGRRRPVQFRLALQGRPGFPAGR